MRFDYYDGIVTATQAEPRLGIAYNIKPTNTVLRVSYARTMETPFNENLVLSSKGCNNAVINALMASTITPCVSNVPLSPGWRNEFHAGLEQAFGRHLVVDGEYIWKYTHQAYDFSVLGDSPITFPIEWDRSKIPGFAIRASVPNWHGLTAFVVMSHVAARFFEPQVSGIGATPVGSEVFRIDHDESFNETTHLQYQPWKKGPWFGFNWRYDSGLVAGPVPCSGGNCANGPNGTGQRGGCVRADAGSAVPGRALLRQRARHPNHADQSQWSVSRRRSTDRTSSRSRRPARRTTTTIRRASQPRSLFDMAVGTTTCSTATDTSGACA